MIGMRTVGVRSVGKSLAATLAAALLAGGTSAQTTYRVVELGSLGGAWHGATEINEGGQVTGFANTSDGNTRAFLWTPALAGAEVVGGQMVGLSALSQDDKGLGINDRGDVAGSSSSAGNSTLWPIDGRAVKLAKLKGPSFLFNWAYGINNSRQVVGRSAGSSYLWQNGKAYLLDHTVLNGATGGEAWDINEAGKVVGELHNGYMVGDNVQGTWGYLWTPDAPNGTKGSMAPLYDILPRCINDNDVVAGHAVFSYSNSPEGARSGAGLWINGTLVDLGTLPNSSSSTPSGMNNRQPIPDVVGRATYPYVSGTPNRGLLWRDGIPYDLNGLLDPVSGAGWLLTEAQDINESGWIACNGTKNGVRAGCVLIPTP